ncbi:helix-turn-helix domain-containing protein [Novosphingobium aerophilum]|uniref:helix-turn-helix domain-containing protein n=1 Tax=Novosphingobium TaxID=165696 RepID=UPI0037580A31
MTLRRTFAGTTLRSLRAARGMKQADLAKAIGISASYLSQLESDDRPLTPAIFDRLRSNFPVEWQDVPVDQSAELLRAFEDAMSDTHSRDPQSSAQVRKIVEQFPSFAESFIQLARVNRDNSQRLEMLDEALGADNLAGGRLPWEEVRDWFHNINNYVDDLDRLAEAFSHELANDTLSPSTQNLVSWLNDKNISLIFSDKGPVRLFDEQQSTLTINTAKANDSLRFHLAWHISSTHFNEDIATISSNADVRSKTARNLLSIGLTNYMAGSILMPYEQFRSMARDMRHDVDRLRHLFNVTFEQVCHRLSTLQRPNARGTPVYFCRVDLAGNITKRHSATRLRFARFGGACPLWVVHEAAAVPDRIHIQLAEMPDGVRYVSMAKGLVKPTGSYAERPRRYAVALGCEVDFAAEFVYADEINLSHPATPIGASCRTCSRHNCDQRAFPPNGKDISIDSFRREVVPYSID